VSEVYEWFMIAEEHALRLLGENVQNPRLHPLFVTEFTCSQNQDFCEVRLKQTAIPVAAFYPLAKDFVVEAYCATGSLIMPKPRGADWVPLVTRKRFLLVYEWDKLTIRPRPDILLVLVLQGYEVSL